MSKAKDANVSPNEVPVTESQLFAEDNSARSKQGSIPSMAYLLEQAAKPDHIVEREWAVGQKIKFGAFTSCIGVVARIADCDKVIGIHLSLMDANSNWIAASDIDQVIKLLCKFCYDAQSVHIIGATLLWYARVKAAYTKLIGLWENPEEKERDDGTLAVSIVNGTMTFKYTYTDGRKDEPFCFPEQQEVARSSMGPLDAAIGAPIGYPRLRARGVQRREGHLAEPHTPGGAGSG